jgi:Fe-S oxidoreductase
VRVSNRITRETALCTYCPKMCRFACPVAEARGSEEVTPWGLMTLLGLVIERRSPVDTELGRLFSQCTGCRRCRTFCEHENDVPMALVLGRKLAVEAGAAPEEARRLVERLRHSGNVHGEDLAARQRDLLGHRPAAGARILFFAGCEAIHAQGLALVDAVRVLEKLNLGPVTVLEDAPCCGRPYHSLGLQALFRAHARELAPRLSRFALVVSSCPECVHTWKVLYPQVGAPVQARLAHFAEVAAERLPRLPARGIRAAYHDACHLGRGLGVYEPVREILRRAGVELVEFFDHHEEARCCGAGNRFADIEPALARAIASRRVADLPAEAEILATACPLCTTELGKVSPRPVTEVATLVARALGVSST